VQPGQTFTVTWPGYSCPAGAGSLSGWTVSVQGAATNAGSIPLGVSPRSTSITAGGSAGTITVRYSAFCGQRDTPFSAPLKVAVKEPTAPTTAPATPEPTDTATLGIGLG
jgi:serine/threonine-protein kinase